MTTGAAPSTDERVASSLLSLVQCETSARLFGVYEYSVDYTEPSVPSLTFSGHPTSDDAGLPQAVQWPFRSGVPGWTGNVRVGSSILVSFVNGDPSRPIVTGYDANQGTLSALAVDGLESTIAAKAHGLRCKAIVDASGTGSVVAVGPSAESVAIASALATIVTDGVQVTIASVPPVVGVLTITGGLRSKAKA